MKHWFDIFLECTIQRSSIGKGPMSEIVIEVQFFTQLKLKSVLLNKLGTSSRRRVMNLLLRKLCHFLRSTKPNHTIKNLPNERVGESAIFHTNQSVHEPMGMNRCTLYVQAKRAAQKTLGHFSCAMSGAKIIWTFARQPSFENLFSTVKLWARRNGDVPLSLL